MRGAEGPHKSTSSKPTAYFPAEVDARVCANWVASVDFPTPPLPDSTKITWATLANVAVVTEDVAGRDATAPDAQVR